MILIQDFPGPGNFKLHIARFVPRQVQQVFQVRANHIMIWRTGGGFLQTRQFPAGFLLNFLRQLSRVQAFAELVDVVTIAAFLA